MVESLVWISGASSGIGAALAAAQPFDDARVVDLSRSGGGPADEHVPADLADPASWPGVATHLAERLGNPGDATTAVFVHCAGVVEPIGPAGGVDPAAYRRAVLLNSAAPQVLGDAWLRAVARFDGVAHLVLVSSGAAHSPYAGWSSYGAGKAAGDQWVRAVGLEQRDRAARGLPWCRVVSVAPGVVETAMQRAIRASSEQDFPMRAKFEGLFQRGELTSPEEAATGIWSLLDRDLESGAVVDLRALDR